MRTFTVYGRHPTEGEQTLIDPADKLHAEWMAEHGARPSDAGRCAHSVLGQRHPSDQWQDKAICHPPGRDHAELFNLPDRRRVLVYHPYSPPWRDEVLIFDAWWRATTLVLPPAESWYWPGTTWRVEVWPP